VAEKLLREGKLVILNEKMTVSNSPFTKTPPAPKDGLYIRTTPRPKDFKETTPSEKDIFEPEVQDNSSSPYSLASESERRQDSIPVFVYDIPNNMWENVEDFLRNAKKIGGHVDSLEYDRGERRAKVIFREISGKYDSEQRRAKLIVRETASK